MRQYVFRQEVKMLKWVNPQLEKVVLHQRKEETVEDGIILEEHIL